MAASPIRKARFSEDLDKEFIKLQQRLKLDLVHGGESKTLQQAVILANKHMDLLQLIEKLKQQWFGGII